MKTIIYIHNFKFKCLHVQEIMCIMLLQEILTVSISLTNTSGEAGFIKLNQQICCHDN